jgi:hypothetical protein
MVTSTCLAASFQRTNVYVLWLLRHSSRLILVKRPYAVSYVPEAGNRSSQRFNFFQKPLHTPNMFWHTLGAEKKKRGICLMFCVSSKRIVYLTMGTRAVLFPQTGRARPYAVVLSRLDLPKHRFDLPMCFSGSLGRVSVSMHVWLRGSSSKY